MTVIGILTPLLPFGLDRIPVPPGGRPVLPCFVDPRAGTVLPATDASQPAGAVDPRAGTLITT